jgi:hypothetical protein
MAASDRMNLYASKIFAVDEMERHFNGLQRNEL